MSSSFGKGSALVLTLLSFHGSMSLPKGLLAMVAQPALPVGSCDTCYRGFRTSSRTLIQYVWDWGWGGVIRMTSAFGIWQL